MKSIKNKTKTSPNPFFKRFRFAALITVITVVAVGIAVVVSAQKGKSSQENGISVSRSSKQNKQTIRSQAAPIDPKTGLVRPLTAEEAQTLAVGIKEIVNDSDEGLTQVQQADGSVRVDLQGHYQNATLAKINDDGTVSESCVNNTTAAADFFGIDAQDFNNPSRITPDSIKTENNGQGEIK